MYEGVRMFQVFIAQRISFWRVAALLFALALLASIGIASPAIARADAATGSGGLLVSKTARIWDTPTGRDGAPTAKMVGGSWYDVPVAGSEGLPATGISALSLDFTVSNAASGGVLNADKAGTDAPNATVTYVNYGTTTTSHTGVLAVGSNGKIRVRLTSTADLRIDVQGYYTAGASAAGGYVPVNATAIKSFSAVASNTYLAGFNATSVAGVPSTASGVMLSVTESNSKTGNGYIIAYPTGGTRPSTALYWPGTQTFSWSSSVELNSSKQVTIYVGSGGAVDLSVAIEGYFTASTGSNQAGAFTPGAARVYDSRKTTPVSPIDPTDQLASSWPVRMVFQVQRLESLPLQ
jgi:hypothetical protein